MWTRPNFLLGLTATPERTDGGDLLALCQENLAYRCDLVEGVVTRALVGRAPLDGEDRPLLAA